MSSGNRRRADNTGEPTTDCRVPIPCRSSLTCGNKSEPVTDVLGVVVNDDGPEQRVLDSKGEQADERTAEKTTPAVGTTTGAVRVARHEPRG
ncbi:possible sigma factor [Rhodococcus jostii RHA1]|uniref:Possible sigma factor n=1 Tax=Rhodococcus jostii (strain RHA1) TaxID=101510 RepID=Q0SIL2_RHOJR|nr:possible sigma factor [Rhodococcus jostii RHA1]